MIGGVPLIVGSSPPRCLTELTSLPPGTGFRPSAAVHSSLCDPLRLGLYRRGGPRRSRGAPQAASYEAADSLGLDYWKSMRLISCCHRCAENLHSPGIVSNTFIGLLQATPRWSCSSACAIRLRPLDQRDRATARMETGIYWKLYILRSGSCSSCSAFFNVPLLHGILRAQARHRPPLGRTAIAEAQKPIRSKGRDRPLADDGLRRDLHSRSPT